MQRLKFIVRSDLALFYSILVFNYFRLLLTFLDISLLTLPDPNLPNFLHINLLNFSNVNLSTSLDVNLPHYFDYDPRLHISE